MTGTEREDLKLTLEFLRDWRTDDREWKAATDKRLTKLEQRDAIEEAVASRTAAVAADVKAAANAAQLSRRWRIGLVAGIGTTAALALLNIGLRLLGIGA